MSSVSLLLSPIAACQAADSWDGDNSGILLDCSDRSAITLSTALGIDVLKPAGFELVSIDESEELVLYRTRVDALGREERYSFVEIYFQHHDSNELAKLTRVENPSTLHSDLLVGRHEIPLASGDTLHLLAISRGDNALFMQSRVQIAPEQLFDCFVSGR